MMSNRCAQLLFVLLSFFSFASSRADDRPHIVLIMCDDLGYSDLGCYGGEIDTPHLDQMAREGLLMTQFYNNAKCTETRAALLSGLYHQQTKNLKLNNHVTLAEVLRTAGYQTLMCGKWHVGHFRQQQGIPTERGFDHYFGFLGGAINFFTGLDYGSNQNLMRLEDQPYQVPGDFYSTDDFTDYAMQFASAAVQKDKPFFLYLAHNAPHFPLQAPPDTISKYRGRYHQGWDAVRQKRYVRMIDFGLVDPRWQLSPRDASAPAWETLSEQQCDEEQRLMEVYAAMVDRLDQQIGRLLEHLDELGVSDNTLVMFLSDNGGCPFDHNRTPNVLPGAADSSRTYDTEWANVSNTPFRLYKQWSHEGGISTPMIVRWPRMIDAARRSSTPAHVIDIMPTLLAVAKAHYPKRFQGHHVLPPEGRSLLPIFSGSGEWKPRTMFWDYRGSRAVRDGRWKLVAERGKAWELYNIAVDRTELNNLAKEQHQRVTKMSERYDQWANRIGAKTDAQARRMAPNTQDRYLEPQEQASPK